MDKIYTLIDKWQLYHNTLPLLNHAERIIARQAMFNIELQLRSQGVERFMSEMGDTSFYFEAA